MNSAEQEDTPFISPGRYVANNGRFWIEVRVDDDLGVVSGDLQSTGPEKNAGYANFRTAREPGSLACKELAIAWVDAAGGKASGILRLEPSARVSLAGGVSVHLSLDAELGGLRAGTFQLEAVYSGSALREVGLLIAVEDGVLSDLPQLERPKRLQAITRRVTGALDRARLQVDLREAQTPIMQPTNGWSEAEIFDNLNDVMDRNVGFDLNRPDWDLRLLMLSRTSRDGLWGLLFDIDGPLPRQGVAVFVDSIRRANPDEDVADDRIAHSAVHELGHAMNLRHRFGREVRRSASPSYMNYPWRYTGGGGPDAYWQRSAERQFDDDEREFLRHAPRSQVIPGGSPFGSAVYWSTPEPLEGNDSPPWSDLHLWLTPPVAGTTFAYGQPIFVEVSLLNTGRQQVRLPRHALDVKAGLLEIAVARIGRDGEAIQPFAAGSRMFIPMLERCFEVRASNELALGPGQSMHNNVNLTYGAGGFTFPEPGDYTLTPILTFPPSDPGPGKSDGGLSGLDHVVVGSALRLTVARPENRAQERDGEVLLHRSDIGAALALGGSAAPRLADDELADIRRRRARAARSTGRPDPVLAPLARCAGISADRRGETTEARDRLLEATTDEAAAFFDPHTAHQTRQLAAKYRNDASRPADPSVVVVDLWSRPTGGDERTLGRASGLLVSRGAPAGQSLESSEQSGWGVLASASGLPIEAMSEDYEVGAEVTVTSVDGLTERMTASRVDLASGGEGQAPGLILLELAHSAPPGPRRLAGEPYSAVSPDLEFFGPEGSPTRSLAELAGTSLDEWTQAADLAMTDLQERMDDPSARALGAPLFEPADVHRYPGLNPQDVGWVCLLVPWCEPSEPPCRDADYGWVSGPAAAPKGISGYSQVHALVGESESAKGLA